MIFLIITVFFTIGISALCSTLEAMILSTTPIEIENLKRNSRKKGLILEELISHIDKTTSSILTANTIANTFGATLAGAQFSVLYGHGFLTTYFFPAFLTISILFFSEILPKNIGILYRPFMQRHLIYVLSTLCTIMAPVSQTASWLIGKITTRRNTHTPSDDEILLLANKGEEDGLLTSQERDLIANSLSLDDVTIAQIMTPRTVVMGLDEDMTVQQAFNLHPNLNFSRIPVYKDSIDNIKGIVRRRDILTAMANDKHNSKISEFTQPATFVPENGSALSVLKQLIKKHQQMGIVVDEFASLTGVITLEDIFEHLLGSEIFETDDIAVDMRELARHRGNSKKK